LKRLFGFALLAATAVLLLPTCRTTRHTVARVVTPAAVPTEIFVPAEPAPAAPAGVATAIPATAPPMPSPTPTASAMPVVTSPPGAREERSPGVLYEQYVPTVVAVTPVTPVVTPIATRVATPRSTRPPRTATPAATQKPGVYYEDPEGRPLTPTPTD
jgi:hypothetical protein